MDEVRAQRAGKNDMKEKLQVRPGRDTLEMIGSRLIISLRENPTR